MHRIILVKHNPTNANGSPVDLDVTDPDHVAAALAHHTAKLNRERLADQDYIAYWWDGRIWAVRRVLDAEPAGYWDDPSGRYSRAITTVNGVAPAIRDKLLAYRGPWFGTGQNTARYGTVDNHGDVSFD